MTTFQLTAEALPIHRITPAEDHYFFGYYEKTPWHRNGRQLLACRSSFMDRAPREDDVLEVGVLDVDSKDFRCLATTRAWNWQQGCMLQWLDERHAVFNDRVNEQFVGIILEVATGEKIVLPRPIYSISPAQGIASSLSFSRLHRLRPGYGYAGVPDSTSEQPAPADDGLWMMDLRTGDATLILSLAKARQALTDERCRDTGNHWMNHAQFAPNGRRLAVLHRWDDTAGSTWQTRMLTLGRDGENLYPLIDRGMCSHYDWRDDNALVAYARANYDGALFDRFFIFQDQSNNVTPIASELLQDDGHCSYSPDRQWILNDTYPSTDDQHRTLMVIRVRDQAVFSFGRYLGPNPHALENRCDLHPRWSPDGQSVCIDSIHEGFRGMYVIDLHQLFDTQNQESISR